MKIQSLAIIFIIIILPISLVLSEYLNNQIETKENERNYNRKLLNSTYDAIKAYQLNTVNNAFGDVTTKKVDDIEAAANTFFNSLASNFNFTGYNSEVMKEYVPAVVFTMYDGYYIYSPFKNTLTGVADDEYDTSFSNKESTQIGLKPYVYYNSRYQRSNGDDFIITYSLDNYITIQGVIGGTYHYDYGYLYRIATSKPDADSNGGIFKVNDTTYYYGGCEFSKIDTEELKEFVGNEQFSYVKINGKKYYLDPDYYSGRGEVNIMKSGQPEKKINADAGIFFIDEKGEKNYNQVPKGYDLNNNTKAENITYLEYYMAITENRSLYEYFRDAYEFSKACFKDPESGYQDKGHRDVSSAGYSLSNLKSSDSYIYKNMDTDAISKDVTDIREYGDFDIFGGNIAIEKASSNFEQHRKSIIRYVIETNLSTAIASFSSGASDTTDFIMPKIEETDWETIENDTCAISFLQGMSIGSKKYNGYSVVANNLTKEYIDENDIYILAKDNVSGNNIYCKPHDRNLFSNYTIQQKNGTTNYYPGIWKLNFETRQDASVEGAETVVYRPLSYYNSSGTRVGYMGSYTSIMGSSGINYGLTEYSDLYSYINNVSNNSLKEAYYKGLARERKCAYNINNINYELSQGNNNQYFLNPYFDESWNVGTGSDFDLDDELSGGGSSTEGDDTDVPDDGSISAEDIENNVEPYIGDFVNYDPLSVPASIATQIEYDSPQSKNGYANQKVNINDYTGKWQLLGVDNSGHILLMSSDLVASDFYLVGKNGWQYGKEELDGICELFGKGKYASGARSVKIEDIDKVTGYNPKNTGKRDVNKTGTGIPYGKGEVFEYDNEVTYSWQGTAYPKYSATNGLSGSMSGAERHSHGFTYWDEVSGSWITKDIAPSGTIKKVKNKWYSYYPTTLTMESSGTVVGIEETSAAYKLIFGKRYYLASPSGVGFKHSITYKYHAISNDFVYEHNFLDSSNTYLPGCMGVRAVVSLKSNCRLVENGPNNWIIKEP